MKLNQEDLRPVIIAMVIYLLTLTLIPRLVKKPTGIQFVDDIVMMIISQRDYLTSGMILTGLIVLLTKYIEDEFF